MWKRFGVTLAMSAWLGATACDNPEPLAVDDGVPTVPKFGDPRARLSAGEGPVTPSGGILMSASSSSSAFTASPFAADFVVTGSENRGSEFYFPSNGDGTFGSRTSIPDLDITDGMDVADIDGDGDNDFLACAGRQGTYLYDNTGAGNFSRSLVAPAVGSYCSALRIADFDEDGRPDFVGGSYDSEGIFVYLQTGSGTFSQVTPALDRPWTSSSFGVAAGDVDGDGHTDVLLMGTYSAHGDVRLYRGDGAGNMSSPSPLFNVQTDFGTMSGGPTGLALFDLEGDSDLDVVAGGTSGSPSHHYVYTNDGAGNFTAPSGPAFTVTYQTGIDAFDFDGDGDHDLIFDTFASAQLWYVSNLGGSLAPPVLVDYLGSFSIAMGAPAATPWVGCQDVNPPRVSLSTTPSSLWPPNHKYESITVTVSVDDDCDDDPTVTTTVVSSEADDANGNGDGRTTGDIRVTTGGGDVLLSSNASPSVPFNALTDQLEVRSEREGRGDGRVYSITVTATDSSGNATTTTVAVTVPHNQ